MGATIKKMNLFVGGGDTSLGLADAIKVELDEAYPDGEFIHETVEILAPYRPEGGDYLLTAETVSPRQYAICKMNSCSVAAERVGVDLVASRRSCPGTRPASSVTAPARPDLSPSALPQCKRTTSPPTLLTRCGLVLWAVLPIGRSAASCGANGGFCSER